MHIIIPKETIDNFVKAVEHFEYLDQCGSLTREETEHLAAMRAMRDCVVLPKGK